VAEIVIKEIPQIDENGAINHFVDFTEDLSD
jgi:hypothetical protein